VHLVDKEARVGCGIFSQSFSVATDGPVQRKPVSGTLECNMG
jgi:hypothetical protein